MVGKRKTRPDPTDGKKQAPVRDPPAEADARESLLTCPAEPTDLRITPESPPLHKIVVSQKDPALKIFQKS